MHKELFGAHAQVSIEDPLTLDGDLHDATIKTRMQALCVKRSGNTKVLGHPWQNRSRSRREIRLLAFAVFKMPLLAPQTTDLYF